MKTTAQFLNAVKRKHHLPSDYALAAHLGLTRSSVSRFMSGKDFLGDETAMKVAELLNLDPAYVVACVHAERASRAHKPAEKKLWEHIAQLTTGLAAGLFLVAILPTATAHLPATDTFNVALRGLTQFDNYTFMANAIYIMRILDTYAVHLISLFFIAFFFRPGKNRRLFDSFRMNAAIRAFRRSAADVGRN